MTSFKNEEQVQLSRTYRERDIQTICQKYRNQEVRYRMPDLFRFVSSICLENEALFWSNGNRAVTYVQLLGKLGNNVTDRTVDLSNLII